VFSKWRGFVFESCTVDFVELLGSASQQATQSNHSLFHPAHQSTRVVPYFLARLIEKDHIYSPTLVSGQKAVIATGI
jgi:hypothetical protein